MYGNFGPSFSMKVVNKLAQRNVSLVPVSEIKEMCAFISCQDMEVDYVCHIPYNFMMR